jgi:hypothetical protein
MLTLYIGVRIFRSIGHFILCNIYPVMSVFCSQKCNRKYNTIILPVVLYGCGTWSLMSKEVQRLRMFVRTDCWGEYLG